MHELPDRHKNKEMNMDMNRNKLVELLTESFNIVAEHLNNLPFENNFIKLNYCFYSNIFVYYTRIDIE